MRAHHIRFLGQVTNHDEAAAAVQNMPGDAVLIVRGIPRSLILNCPCGCGDTLIINLDRRVGPAWRFYLRKDALTLFPSYWRDSHCGSHFILWGNHIYWCDREEWWKEEISVELRNRVWGALPPSYISYDQLAELLGEIPWDVWDACRILAKEGKAERHHDRLRSGEYRRKV